MTKAYSYLQREELPCDVCKIRSDKLLIIEFIKELKRFKLNHSILIILYYLFFLLLKYALFNELTSYIVWLLEDAGENLEQNSGHLVKITILACINCPHLGLECYGGRFAR